MSDTTTSPAPDGPRGRKPWYRRRWVQITGGGTGSPHWQGSARRVRDGELADLTSPLDYPAEAVCLACGQPIRIQRYYLSAWRHIERFTNPSS